MRYLSYKKRFYKSLTFISNILQIPNIIMYTECFNFADAVISQFFKYNSLLERMLKIKTMFTYFSKINRQWLMFQTLRKTVKFDKQKLPRISQSFSYLIITNVKICLYILKNKKPYKVSMVFLKFFRTACESLFYFLKLFTITLVENLTGPDYNSVCDTMMVM